MVVDISIVNGVYKPTNITGGAPPCTLSQLVTPRQAHYRVRPQLPQACQPCCGGSGIAGAAGAARGLGCLGPGLGFGFFFCAI